MQSCDALGAIVDASEHVVAVLTTQEAQRVVSGRKAGLASSLPLDRSLVCRDTDTLGHAVTRLRHTRASGMAVLSEDGRALRTVLDVDIVAPFVKEPAWANHFMARLWTDWLPPAAVVGTPPSDEEGLGRRRSVSWSMPAGRARAGSGSTTASDSSPRKDSLSQSPPRRDSLTLSPRHDSNSPLRFFAMGALMARARSSLSAGE